MKKQKIALLLSCFWLLGLAAAVSFSPDAKAGFDLKENQSLLNEEFSPELSFLSSGENPEVPGFKADLGFSGLFQSAIWIDWLPSHYQYLSPAFFKKSSSFFDVFVSFFYFFYTW
jgi:hypothetical protein